MQHFRSLTLAAVALALPLSFAHTTVAAQSGNYPDQTIRLVVPLGPGSATDALARVLAEPLSKDLGVPVIIENRAGAGGQIGANYVAQASPDGYTLGFFHSSVLSAAAVINPDLAYDPLTDFTPLGMAASNPIVLVVKGDSRFETMEQYLEEARANPETVTAGFIGVGSHSQYNIELTNTLSGAKVSAIPYSGGPAPLITGLLGDQVDSISILYATVASQVAAGQMRLLATGAPLADHPDVPTYASLDLDRADMVIYSVLMAPPGLPEPIATRLTDALERAVADPAVAERIRGMGFIVQFEPPAVVQKLMEDEAILLSELSETLNITIQ